MKSFDVMKKKAALFCLALIPILLPACAKDCSTLRTYTQPRNRQEIAIVRTDLCPIVKVNAVDRKPVRGDFCYFLLEPGRHEFIVSYSDGKYAYHNISKYLEAAAGRTYRIKLSTGISFFSNNKTSLDIVDVTNDQQLHFDNLPEKGRYHCE